MCRRFSIRDVLITCLLLTCASAVQAQASDKNLFNRADSLHQGRFWAATGTIAALYAGTVIGLNEVWYKQYPRTGFHFFNDWGEWNNMDKAGHLFTSYFESQWMYSIARWTGVPEKKAIWVGAGMGILMQSTIEVMDAFSEKWGFSVADFGFNILGSATFLTQQKLWGEQRILLKMSSYPKLYPPLTVSSQDGEYNTTLRTRTNNLFGTGFFERFLKDYNAQTIWASVNIHAFLHKPETRFPKWLNIAVGYGSENLYGGYQNAWEQDGVNYVLNNPDFDRYQQFYISLDIDFTKIPSKSPFVRTLLGMLNVFKIPAPALEINKVDGVKFHVLQF